MTTVNKVISLRAEEEGSNPFVVAFDSAPQSEILESAGSKRSKNGRITCYERPFKKRSLGGGDVAADSDGEGSPASDSDNNDANGKDFGRHIDVVAETPKVVFHGTTTGRTTLPLRHAIGIRDSKAGTITFVEVPPVVALHKFLKLGAEDLEEDVQREAGAAIDLKDYMKHKHSLTDTFGNHKKKLQIRAATANALPDKIDDVDEAGLQEAARAVAKGASEAAEAAKELTADLPALNPDAKTPAEAYALKDIVFPDVWNEMLATAADLMPYADEGPLPLSKKFAEAGPSLSVYTAERIKYINSVPKERLQTTLAALFLVNNNNKIIIVICCLSLSFCI